MPLRLLYVMDPLSRVLVDKDTTFAFLLEGERRGHEQHHCGVEDLFVERSVAHARARPVRVRRAAIHYTLGDQRSLPLGAFDVVFMRKDPPFDLSYYFATQLLGLADPAVTLVVNDPRGLREANEKLYALHFPELIPESLVAADPVRLKAFMAGLGGEMIVKPLDGCGGAGVFHLHRGDRNLNAILELSTLNGTRMVMAQRYLPAVRSEGDKRPIVLAGEPLGAIRRVPREDETRGNIHVGGRVERAVVDARDREICRRMAPRLEADGIYFVGLDVIGGLGTQGDVTSPTGGPEIDRPGRPLPPGRGPDRVGARAARLERATAATARS